MMEMGGICHLMLTPQNPRHKHSMLRWRRREYKAYVLKVGTRASFLGRGEAERGFRVGTSKPGNVVNMTSSYRPKPTGKYYRGRVLKKIPGRF